MKKYIIYRLIKSEDLNHHGTLFAGRISEWFVEAGFIAATNFLNPENIVCVKIHGMHFAKPINRGDIIKITSQIAYTGNTSIRVYVKIQINKKTDIAVNGFLTFVNVNESGKPERHNIKIKPKTKEDKELYQKAKQLSK